MHAIDGLIDKYDDEISISIESTDVKRNLTKIQII